MAETKLVLSVVVRLARLPSVILIALISAPIACARAIKRTSVVAIINL
jgi:hypothetical protein